MILSKKLSEVEIMPNAHDLDARNLYDSPFAVVTVITLKPGQALKKHITPVDVVFYVLKGKGRVQIGDEMEIVEKDTLIESPKDVLHCWYNDFDSELSVMVIKAPRPTEKTIFVE